MKERNKAVPAVYLFLEKEGKILLHLRQNTGYMDGNWDVPAGHVEESELPTAAMVREAKEEIGITLRPEDLKPALAMYKVKHDTTGDRADYFFRATRWEGEITNMEPQKCADIKWFDPTMLPLNMTPHIREAIDCVLKGISYTELDERWLRSHGAWTL